MEEEYKKQLEIKEIEIKELERLVDYNSLIIDSYKEQVSSLQSQNSEALKEVERLKQALINIQDADDPYSRISHTSLNKYVDEALNQCQNK